LSTWLRGSEQEIPYRVLGLVALSRGPEVAEQIANLTASTGRIIMARQYDGRPSAGRRSTGWTTTRGRE
jgi:hypothetical protein